MELAADGYEATLAAELGALHERLLQEHRKVLNRNGSLELYSGSQSSSTAATSGMGPKLLKPVQGMLHGDETGDGSEISSKLSGGCGLFDKAYAHEVNSVHDKWFVLSLKLTDQEAEDALDRVVPFPVAQQESIAGSGSFIKLLPAWNRGLHESFRQQKRAKRRSMRGVSARMNEKVKDNTCLQPLIIVPSSPKRVSWTFLGFVFIVWDLVTIPMTMFDIPGFSDFLDLMGRITFGYFLLDVFLHFIFAVDIKGQLEMRPKVIARTYVRSWFSLDVLLLLIDVMLFTLEAIASGGDAMSGLKTMRLLRSLRLLRLMRLLRIGKLKEVLQILANRFSSLYFLMILKILSGFGMVLAVNHFIACSWYGVGLVHVDTVSWLTESQMQEASFAEGYITAMHWSLTQFTPATNNVAPANYLERMVAVFVILLAMGVFSSFVSSITSAVNSLRAVRMEQIKQETKIRQFFSERNLSAELFNKVQDVCRKRGLFEIRLKEEEVALLNEIPESLKRRLHEEIYLPLLSIAPFLPPWSHSQEYRFMRKVCHVAMQERSALSSQDVFVLGWDCKEMIMVQYGAMGYHVVAKDSSRMQDSVEFDVRDRMACAVGEILCMPCLFAKWQTRGRLTADAGTCHYVVIRSDPFCSLTMQHRGPLSQYLQIFAMLFISVLEGREDEGEEITDLNLPDDVLDNISKRSQRFADIMNKRSGNSAMREARTGSLFTDMGLADGPTRVEHYGFLGLSHRSSSSSGRSSGRSVKKYESEDDDF